MCQSSMKLETEANFEGGFVFLVWPVTVVHRIDSTSPLWDMSSKELIASDFEIVVILEGTIESTGNQFLITLLYLLNKTNLRI